MVIENFGSYRGEHRFAFPDAIGLYNLTGVNEDNPRLGANGAGKSTLLNAIRWCLYGRTSRGLKAGDVVTRGEKRCNVTVHMMIGSGNERTISRTQNPNELLVNGKVVDQEHLDKLLRLTPEAFDYAVMMPQFGQSFFELQPAAKLTLFSQIMDLEYWLEKSKAASKAADGLASEKSLLERELARAEGQIETAAIDIGNFKGQDANFAAEQAVAVKALRVEYKRLTKTQDKLESDLKQYNNVLARAEQKLAALPTQAETCPTCKQPVQSPKTANDVKALVQNCADFTREIRTVERELDITNHRCSRLEIAIDAESKRKSPYAELLKTKEKLLLATKQKLEELKAEIERVNSTHAAVSYWINGFKRVRLFVVEEALSQLELEVNNNLTSLGLTDWRITFDVERENRSGGVTKGFSVFVYPPDSKDPIRLETYSGGETQRLRLAGDLGLANLIMERAGLSNMIEFYDEPSARLSQEGLADLAETLHQRAHTTGRRIWLIDHHTIDFGGFAGHLIARKGALGSRLTWAV